MRKKTIALKKLTWGLIFYRNSLRIDSMRMKKTSRSRINYIYCYLLYSIYFVSRLIYLCSIFGKQA